MLDLVEISGGNAEQSTSKLHSKYRNFNLGRLANALADSFGSKTISEALVMRESTRIREAFFTDFAERVMTIESDVPIQLSGDFRSRTGMADAVASGNCDLVGLGRAAALEPSLPRKILLNEKMPDDIAIALPHIVRGQWLARWIPVKVVGSGMAIQFFYWKMRRLGNGLQSDPGASIPYVVAMETLVKLSDAMRSTANLLQSWLPGMMKRQGVKAD